MRRKPGEAILIPELSASGNITASDHCPRYEHEHRKFDKKNMIQIIWCKNTKFKMKIEKKSI